MANDAAVAIRQDAIGSAKRASRCRHKDLVEIWKSRQRWEDADNGVGLVVHLEDLADDVRIARKTFLPEVIAQQQHRRGSLLVLPGQESAAEKRFDPESIKKIIRYDSG